MFSIFILVSIYLYLYKLTVYSYNVTIETDDIPNKYIYHLNTTTNSIEDCEFYDTTICRNSYCFTTDEYFICHLLKFLLILTLRDYITKKQIVNYVTILKANIIDLYCIHM